MPKIMPNLPVLFASFITLLPLVTHADTGFSYDYGGKTISGTELPAAIRNQLYELDLKANEQRKQIVDQYILEYYLKEVAKEKGKTAEEIATELLEVPPPDDKAVRDFYDENWERIQQPFDQVKDQLVTLVSNQQQQAKVEELLKTITTEKQYKVNLVEPDTPSFTIKLDGYPVKGNPGAAVTVVEFADFQCPHCKDAVAAVNTILKEHADEVRFVYRHMPINPSGISRKVAEGSVCADQQGKFWEYHALAFEVQSKLKEESPLLLAQETGLDEDKFKTCLADPETAKAIQTSEEEAAALGVTGTPSFFINGKPFQPQFDLEKELVAAIEAAIPKTDKAAEASSTDEAKPEATTTEAATEAVPTGDTPAIKPAN